MYNSLKAKWNEQPSLAANQHFPKFRYYLERGGRVALDYIAKNADFVETVLGGPDKVAALEEAIVKRNIAAENQKYFVGEAKRLEGPIKAVLRTRYNALKGYCEQNSLPWSELTPETLLPTTRRAAEAGSWESVETAPEPITTDEAPATEDSAATAPNVSEYSADKPTTDEDTLRARIAELHKEGLSKTDIWTEVKSEAISAKWTRAAVWAYVDELLNVE